MNPSSKPSGNLLNWLGLSDRPDWEKARWLGALFGTALLALFCLCAIAAFAIVMATIGSAFQPTSPGPNLGTGALITGLLGAPFLIWRTIVAQKTVDLQREGHITDRIAKAVEQLGTEKTVKRIHEIPRYQKEGGVWRRDDNGRLIEAIRPDGTPLVDRESHELTVPNIEVRIGGLYALERIAQDSMLHEGGREHLPVMEIICSYIRENAPAQNLEPAKPPFSRKKPRTDIQVALTIIGRRSKAQVDWEAQNHYRLDLRGSDLDGSDFRKGNFSAAMFHHSRFEAALFNETSLHGSQFYGALLNYATFWQAELVGTNCDRCVLSEPRMAAISPFSPIGMSEFIGVSFVGADISALRSLGGNEYLASTFGSKDTKLSENLAYMWSEISEALIDYDLGGTDPLEEMAAANHEKLKHSGFIHWSPYTSDDLATEQMRKNFLDGQGLAGWPYQDS